LKCQLQTYTGPETGLYDLDMNLLIPASAGSEITGASLIKGRKVKRKITFESFIDFYQPEFCNLAK